MFAGITSSSIVQQANIVLGIIFIPEGNIILPNVALMNNPMATHVVVFLNTTSVVVPSYAIARLARYLIPSSAGVFVYQAVPSNT